MELKIAAALNPSHLPHSTRETAKDLSPAEQVETVRELAANRCQEAIQAWRDRGFTMEQVAHEQGSVMLTQTFESFIQGGECTHICSKHQSQPDRTCDVCQDIQRLIFARDEMLRLRGVLVHCVERGEAILR
jgi:hypothetical protein